MELRLARVAPEQLPPDLATLLELYEAELDERSLVDLPGLLALATANQSHPWIGLPLARLDADLESRAHQEFFASLAARAPEVLEAELPPESTVLEPNPVGTLEHLRQYLFSTKPQPYRENDGRFEFFSAPGEGLEAVEIARRIIRLAREGSPSIRWRSCSGIPTAISP